MGATVTVEVLIRRAAAIERSLPQLAQVGVDKAILVTGSAERGAQGPSATGAIACPWLGATVACPHQTVLLIITEVLGLTAS